MRVVALNLNGFRPAARLRDIEGILHPHQSLHIDAESFLKPQRHVTRKISFCVQEAGKRRPRYAQNLRGFRHGKIVRLDNLRFQKAPV